MEGVITIGAAEVSSDLQHENYLQSQRHSTLSKNPSHSLHEGAHGQQMEQCLRTPTPFAHGHQHYFQKDLKQPHQHKSTTDSHSRRTSLPSLQESDLFSPPSDKLKALQSKLDQILEDNQKINQKLGRSLRRVRHLRKEKSLLLDRLLTFGHRSSGSGTDNDGLTGGGSRGSDSLSARDRHITASKEPALDNSREALHTSTSEPNLKVDLCSISSELNPEIGFLASNSEPSPSVGLHVSNWNPSQEMTVRICNSEPCREKAIPINNEEPGPRMNLHHSQLSREIAWRVNNWEQSQGITMRISNSLQSEETAWYINNSGPRLAMDLCMSSNSRPGKEALRIKYLEPSLEEPKGLYFRKVVDPQSSSMLIKEFNPSEITRPAVIASAITNVGSAKQKPKRVHQPFTHRIDPSTSRKVFFLPRDENGSVKMPVQLGILTLWSTGRIVYDRETFHNERYIWPVGYKASRLYNSMIDPFKKATYMCSVVDDGNGPKFHVEANDQPGKPIIAGTATGAWTHIVKVANDIRKRNHTNAVSGPDYYGFSNDTVAMIIQQLPNAEKCTRYVRRIYVEVPFGMAAGDENPKSRKRRRRGDVAETATIEGTGCVNSSGYDFINNDDIYMSLGTSGTKKRLEVDTLGRWSCR